MVPLLSATGCVVDGVVGDEGDAPPHPLIVIDTPPSMASRAATVNSRRSVRSSRLFCSFINSKPRRDPGANDTEPSVHHMLLLSQRRDLGTSGVPASHRIDSPGYFSGRIAVIPGRILSSSFRNE